MTARKVAANAKVGAQDCLDKVPNDVDLQKKLEDVSLA